MTNFRGLAYLFKSLRLWRYVFYGLIFSIIYCYYRCSYYNLYYI